MKNDKNSRVSVNFKKKETRQSEILKLLYSCVVLPYQSLCLLDDQGRTYLSQTSVKRLKEQKLIEVNGKGTEKHLSLPVNKTALEKLYNESISNQLTEQYEQRKKDVCQKVAPVNQNRQMMRKGDTLARMVLAGIETSVKEGKLDYVEYDADYPLAITDAKYFTRREIKEALWVDTEMVSTDKTTSVSTEYVNALNHSNIYGIITSPGGIYAVYSLWDKLIDWYTYNEKNAKDKIKRTLKVRGVGNEPLESVVFSKNNSVLEELVLNEYSIKEAWKQKRIHIDSTYAHMYGLPNSMEGLYHLKLMTMKNWKEDLIKEYLSDYDTEAASYYRTCDAINRETNSYVLLYCIPDLVNLKSFLENAWNELKKERYEIICFDYQKDMIEYLSNNCCTIKTVSMNEYVEKHSDILKQIGRSELQKL